MSEFQKKKKQGEKNQNPIVSIIMPAWNAEKTIQDAIRSVIKQTESNWELIVIDDYSEDETYKRIRWFAARDNRIRIYRNPVNLGVSKTRNRGVKVAKGKWIAFLDSDDIWRADKLEKQLCIIEQKKNVDLVFTGSVFMRGWEQSENNRSREKTNFILSYYQKAPKTITYKELLKQNLISCSSVVVKKELLMKYPMKQDIMHEDYATWLEILRAGGKACGINEPLLIYRISGKSRSGDKRRAAQMTWRVYRFLGLHLWEACYYFGWYVCKNGKKYFHINHSKYFS